MQNGWIKLHRQLQKNPIFRYDKTAWNVFEVLLLNADENGDWEGGRFQLAQLYGKINDNTLYSAISRLKTAQMVNTTSNNKFTVYHICNWEKYQSTVNTTSNNKSTTNQHSIKNKEYKNSITNVIPSISKEIPVHEKKFFDLYIELFNKNPNTTKLTKARSAKLKLRLKENGAEQLEAAIRKTAASSFYRGNNDRGWHANLDFIIRSTEQVERLAELPSEPHRSPQTRFQQQNNTRTLSDEERASGRLKMAQIRKQLIEKGVLH